MIPSPEQRALGELLAKVTETSDAMDREGASGWVVVVIDEESESDKVAHVYGPWPTPEEALVAAGRMDQIDRDAGEAGWRHEVKPLFPTLESA